MRPIAFVQSNWVQAQNKFRQIWGYNDFRPPQGEIIQSLLTHRDTLVVMPTGGGKSICFQLPALLRSGVTLVVSPLVALMENQVFELRSKGLPAALLHSDIPRKQRHQILRGLEYQKIRLLYLSPETLLNPSVWERLANPQVHINGIILDEAHCLVQWGDSFRPAYRRLGAVRPALLAAKPAGTQMAIAAFTATADPVAQQTIQQVLGLHKPQSFLLNPYRENLHLAVTTSWSEHGRRQRMLQFLQAHPQQSGLIYVRTRRDSEAIAAELAQKGYATSAYHAGLPAEDRRQVESDWLSGQLQFVICTSAFGMGINKPDVRWVLHFHPPALLSEYVQEVGRAGRDGKPAEALMLVSEPTGWLDPSDQQRQEFFLQQERSQRHQAQQLLKTLPPVGEVNTVARQHPNGALALAILHSIGQLEWTDPFHYRILAQSRSSTQHLSDPTQSFRQYLRTRECRWRFLLQAFGFEKDAHILRCGHCDRCR